MHKIGIPILILLYFGAGASIGSIIFDLAHGRGDQIAHEYATLAFAGISNTILLPCLLLLWRRRHVAPKFTAASPELRVSRLIVHGLPVNARIAFLLFYSGWVIGFFVPIVFGF